MINVRVFVKLCIDCVWLSTVALPLFCFEEVASDDVMNDVTELLRHI